ncbi:hypothetical protein PPROV_000237900 [Pycnococcus provasolii]|uniref:ABC transporter domain-containing protein n=1 Tax=Pycnococcus provasolii TaxID=41880 RepID=A0A830H9A1_9CHLO|nr:hypothetical protein PPROV_000237900 [Pycnococcus provasolii]
MDGSRGQTVSSGFREQTRALLLKNAVLQKRNYCTNICIVITPLIFSLVILGIQFAIDTLFLSNDDFKCGCQCTKLKVRWGTKKEFDLQDYGGEDFPDTLEADGVKFRPTDLYSENTRGISCLLKNKNKCASKYSTASQVAWCPLESPNQIQPTLQMPKSQYRATDGLDANACGKGHSGDPRNPTKEAHYADDPARCPATLLVSSNTASAAAKQSLLDGLGEPSQLTDVSGDSENPLLAMIEELNKLTGSDQEAAAAANKTSTRRQRLASNDGDGDQDDGEDDKSMQSRFEGMTMESIQQMFSLSSQMWSAIRSEVGQLGTTLERGITRFTQIELSGDDVDFYYAKCDKLPESLKTALFDLGTNSGTGPLLCVDKNVHETSGFDAMRRMLYNGYGYGAMESNTIKRGSGVIRQYVGAIDFADADPSAKGGKFNLDIMYNGTTIEEEGGDGGPQSYWRDLTELQNMATRSFVKASIERVSGSKIRGDHVPARYMYTREMPKQGTSLRLEFSTFLGPLFYTWLLQILLPIMAGQMVQEKENRLRVIMRMHGLGDGAYWLINLGYWLVMHMLYSAMVLGFGHMVNISFFTMNDSGVMYMGFLMFSLVQMATAVFITSIFSNARSASTFCVVLLLATGLLGEFLVSPYIESHEKGNFPSAALWIVQLIPSFGLYRMLWEFAQYSFLGVYTNEFGITWDIVSSDNSCHVAPLLGLFALETAVIMLVSLYVDQTFATGGGVPKHWLFPLHMMGILKPPSGGSLLADDMSSSIGPSGMDVEGKVLNRQKSADTDDVAEARLHAESQSLGSTECAIVMKQISMCYPARGGMPPKVACDSLSLAIERGECFGLLGPNGAGKSTVINMLTGLMSQTSGTAYVENMELGLQMTDIYKLMGVCPQHDLLWPTLTAAEHLNFYGRLKKLVGAELKAAVDEGLAAVNLLNVANKRVGEFSGGMKRRLSVAISLMGKPKVVYMDEPSTGLDPASRKALWKVIKAAKKNTCMILTTHSMEEAGELCDRLGIFVGGKMQCVGSPRELTSRYGGFLILNILGPAEMMDSVSNFMRSLARGARRTYALGGLSKWEIPLSEANLSATFSAIEGAKSTLKIDDWSVSNLTLEEVFIKVCRDAGIDTGSID